MLPVLTALSFGLTCAPVLDDGETRYVMSSVEQFEIPANAKNPELAKSSSRFLYTEDSVKLFAEKANGIYALKKANEMVKGIVSDGVLQHERHLSGRHLHGLRLGCNARHQQGRYR